MGWNFDAGGILDCAGNGIYDYPQSGLSGMSSVTPLKELVDAINNVGFWDSIRCGQWR